MKARKILLLLVFAAVVAAFYFLDLGKYLTLESLKANRALLTDLRMAHAVLFAAIFVLVYIVQTAFSLPGAAILSLAAGAIFGVLLGTLFVVSGATVGAILAFLVSRTSVAGLGGEEVRRADGGDRRNRWWEHLRKYANPELAARLKEFGGKISYDYDWRINEQ